MIERATQDRTMTPAQRAEMLRASWEWLQRRKADGRSVDPANEESLRRLVEKFAPEIL